MTSREIRDLLNDSKAQTRAIALELISSLGSFDQAEEAWGSAVKDFLRTARCAGNRAQAEGLALEELSVAFNINPTDPSGIGDVTRPQKIHTVAICGNHERSGAQKEAALNAIQIVARSLSAFTLEIFHGPRGAGITVVNRCHNVWQAANIRSQLVFVDREKLMQSAEMVIIIGGGTMTQVEADIAKRKHLPIAAIPGTGGVAEIVSADIRHGRIRQVAATRELSRFHDYDELGDWVERAITEGV